MNILLKSLEAIKQRINPRFDGHKKWISNNFMYQISIKQNIAININHCPLQEKPATASHHSHNFLRFNSISSVIILLALLVK